MVYLVMLPPVADDFMPVVIADEALGAQFQSGPRLQGS